MSAKKKPRYNPLSDAIMAYKLKNGETNYTIGEKCGIDAVYISRIVSGSNIPGAVLFSKILFTLDLDAVKIINQMADYHNVKKRKS